MLLLRNDPMIARSVKEPSRIRTAATPAESVIVIRLDGENVVNGTFPFAAGVELMKAWGAIIQHYRIAAAAKATRAAVRGKPSGR
jgi:hypothetical protein